MFRSLCAGAPILGLVACAQTQALPVHDSGAVERDVTDLIQRWSDAGEAGHWDVVAATYADVDGFAWIEQGVPRYTSRAAIVAGLEQARQMRASIRNDVSDIVVTPLGNDVAAFRAN
ncbi:MAG: nuclear transport factor 2 family protein [Pseudomonadota bacterium]|nr:nuclear transport factor 2 family protein [Alphaproteobacteria bacterium]MDZ4812958.1 nuclear transport factor 2 family protein [Pseudomonadota bacterium]